MANGGFFGGGGSRGGFFGGGAGSAPDPIRAQVGTSPFFEQLEATPRGAPTPLLPERSESRLRRELSGITGFASGIAKGLVEVGKDVGRLATGRGPKVLQHLPGAVITSFKDTVTGQNIRDAIGGKTSFSEALLEDLGNVLAVVSGGASVAGTVASRGAIAAGKAGQAGRAAQLAKTAATAKKIARPLRTGFQAGISDPARRVAQAARETGEAGFFGRQVGRAGRLFEEFDVKGTGKDFNRKKRNLEVEAHDFTRTIDQLSNELERKLPMPAGASKADRRAIARQAALKEARDLTERARGQFGGPTALERAGDKIAGGRTIVPLRERAINSAPDFLDRFPELFTPDLPGIGPENLTGPMQAAQTAMRGARQFRGRADRLVQQRAQLVDEVLRGEQRTVTALRGDVPGERITRRGPAKPEQLEKVRQETLARLDDQIATLQGRANSRELEAAASLKEVLKASEANVTAKLSGMPDAQLASKQYFQGMQRVADDLSTEGFTATEALQILRESGDTFTRTLDDLRSSGIDISSIDSGDFLERARAIARSEAGVQMDDVLLRSFGVPSEAENFAQLRATPGWQVVQHLGTGQEFALPARVATIRSTFTSPRVPTGRIVTGLDRFTDEFRHAVLNMSPRWLVNNTFGNAFLGSLASGPGTFIDVGREIAAGIARTRAGRGFAEIEGVPGELRASGISSEFVPGGGILARGPIRPAIRATAKVNSITDDIFRSTVFKRKVRKEVDSDIIRQLNDGVVPDNIEFIDPDELFARVEAGDALTKAENQVVETSLKEARNALVDYGNLTPFERNFVRRVVPFYTWQKGITKLAMSLPVDHPLRFVILEQISNHAGGFSRDEREQYPGFLVPQVDINGAIISTRGLNPFADVTSVLDPQELLRQLTPPVEIGTRFITRKPELPFGPREVTAGGFTEPEVGLEDLSISFFRDLPQARLLGEAGIPGFRNLPAQTLGSAGRQLLGINIRDPEHIARAQERLIESRAEAVRSQQREREFQLRQRLGITSQRAQSQLTSSGSRGFFGGGSQGGFFG